MPFGKLDKSKRTYVVFRQRVDQGQALLPREWRWRSPSRSRVAFARLNVFRVPRLCCPACGTAFLLNPVFTYDRHGRVSNRVRCPSEACSWSDFVQMDGVG